jgi:hypothetical protein
MRYIFAALLFPLWIIPALVCGFFKDAGVVSDLEAEEDTRQELIKLLQELHGDDWGRHYYD